MRHFLVALQFFTRIPVTGTLARWVGYSPEMLRASAGHFPGVGWVVGAAGAAAMWAGLLLLPGEAGALAAALIGLMVTACLTGAFHEDGLADLADGLGGSADRERALQIMKDSRIGSYGTLAMVLVVGLKVALLATLAAQDDLAALAGLVAAHVLSRFCPLFVMRALPYVDRDDAKAKPVADSISSQALTVALLWSLPALALLGWTQPFENVLGAGVLVVGVVAWMIRMLRRRLAGFTGDALGATQQLCEVAIYLALAVQLS
nr:adenosylcobinamide-GDP ribazoletransferase [Variovorax dokdonensis]